MRFRSLVVISLFAASSLIARADSLIGSTVDVQYLFPNTGASVYNSGPETISPTLKNVIPEAGATVSFAPHTITLTNDTLGYFTNAPFNGLDISFLSGFQLTNVVIDSASTPAFANGAVLSFTGNDIRLNIAGQCNANDSTCLIGEKIILDVTGNSVAPTPEPSSLALLGTSLLGAAGVLRKRLA